MYNTTQVVPSDNKMRLHFQSVIMTAKDIPLNAFMAMRGAAAGEKDEKWLQGFLSESVVEEVPWECSKALIIMKDGFQVETYRLNIPNGRNLLMTGSSGSWWATMLPRHDGGKSQIYVNRSFLPF